jgi:ribosomal protein S18 acetylase RimI-like enzyme
MIISITTATPEDLPEIAGLARVIWYEHYPGIITLDQIEYMLERGYATEVMRREIESEGIHYDLLRADGKPIGFISYGAYSDDAEIKVHKLYILAAHHRKGYGRLLLQSAETFAKVQGITTLVLNVNKNNNGSIAAYLKIGFEIRESIFVDIGQGYDMDDFVLSKDLTGKSESRFSQESEKSRFSAILPVI